MSDRSAALVRDLIDPDARELALLELSKQREKFPELAPFLWNSFGTMAVLLQVRCASPAARQHARLRSRLDP
jgi:Cell differentiation family, Rcd1-like